MTISAPTGTIPAPSRLPGTTRSSALSDWDELRAESNLLADRVQAGQFRAAADEVNNEALTRAKEPTAALLDHLADLGFSWRDIARFCGISVPALRKWRLGQVPSPERRATLNAVVATFDVIARHRLIDDIASWSEIPLGESTISPGDFVASHLFEEAIELAGAVDAITCAELLGKFDPDWRRTRVRGGYQVVEDEDGYLAIHVDS